MNDADRAECEAVWLHIAGGPHPKEEALQYILAAKRKWENAKLEEAAQRCTKQAHYYRDNVLYQVYCLNGMEWRVARWLVLN